MIRSSGSTSPRKAGLDTGGSTRASPAWRAWIADTFFPAPIRLDTTQMWAVTAASGLFVVAAFVVLLNWRAYPTSSDMIWAEDGRNFLPDAVREPWPSTLLQPYAGYAHVVPRTIAAIVVLLPVHHWPLALALASIALRTAVALFVWHATAGHVPSKLARSAISVTVITLPLGGAEVLNNIANAHWFLLFAAVPALLWQPSTWFGRVIQTAVVVLSMLSDPITLLWTPLVVLRVISVRELRPQVVCIGFVLAAVVQLAVTFQTTRPRGPGTSLAQMAETYVVRTAEPTIAGIHISEWSYEFHRAAGIAFTVLVIATIVVLGLIPRGPHRGLILSGVGGSIVFYVFILDYTDPAVMLPELTIVLSAAGRYGAMAGMLLITGLIASAWSLLHFSNRLRPLAAIAVLALAGLYTVGVVQAYGDRLEGASAPAWPDAIGLAQADCAVSGTAVASVPIEPPGWFASLPCDKLR